MRSIILATLLSTALPITALAQTDEDLRNAGRDQGEPMA
jgi:hypothetical protein